MTGFSGSGKTTVAREVARRLGWKFVDTDEEIAKAQGKAIESIFAESGEPFFRRLEGQCLADVSAGDQQIVSTGGGIVVSDGNRRIMNESGVVVLLEARPETIYHRLWGQAVEGGEQEVRPMLASDDPLQRIRSLKAERQPFYALADWTVHTDGLGPGEVAEQVMLGWKTLSSATSDDRWDQGGLAHVVRTSAGDYPVWVERGLIDQVGERARRLVDPGAAYIITDEGVYRHARRAQVSMEAAKIPTHLFVITPGESTKTLETASRIYTWLADRRAERGHLVMAIGGGVVGDLAGFVAATFLRGMPFVQVPTSLLAMMDASIGGKTGVDLRTGKNLVGAFYQPRFVLEDVQLLETLPPRELTAGWAEAIKHALIMDENLLRTFERDTDAIRTLDPEVADDVIRRSVALKAEVVSRDERETLGLRILLNYGHTIGHAIEAATGYKSILHGEAVSVGMMGAGHIGRAMGTIPDADLQRQGSLLEAFGLPLTCPGVDPDAVMDAMRSDKKTAGGTIRWVLLGGIGNAVTRNDVPTELVQEVVEQLTQ